MKTRTLTQAPITTPMTDAGPFPSFFLGGFECSMPMLPDGRRLDQLAASQHDISDWEECVHLSRGECLLLPAGKKRKSGLYTEHPLKDVGVLGRVSFTLDGRPNATDFTAFLWQKAWRFRAGIKHL